MAIVFPQQEELFESQNLLFRISLFISWEILCPCLILSRKNVCHNSCAWMPGNWRERVMVTLCGSGSGVNQSLEKHVCIWDPQG